ncbi:hypothetical protein NC651_004602 [Populus alba x Populus x berolinensis]|nr:hypothetical protein NC651_004602 [Populus alba x Populus x berolinensis]
MGKNLAKIGDSASTNYCLKWNSDSASLWRNEATGFEYMHRSRLHERWFCLVHLVAPKDTMRTSQYPAVIRFVPLHVFLVLTKDMGPSGVLSSYPHSKKEQIFCCSVSMFDVNSSSNSDNSNREKKHMLVKGL